MYNHQQEMEKRIDKRDEKHSEELEKFITVIDNNTQAIRELKNQIEKR